MANKKINQLVSKTAILSTDLFGIGDATTGQLYKKTIAELQAAIGGAVISVNGLIGTVVLDTDDIQELVTPTNKWFTDARARAAISLTTTGNSGASTYSSGTGVLNVPTYTLAGLGGITASFLSGTSGISYNSTTGVISYSGTVYTDASIRALLSGSTGISYNSTTGAISYSGTVYTDSSVRALISLTTTGTSGASTYNNTTGVINVPNYTLAGLGGISLTSLSGGTGITYNNTTGSISYSGTVYTDASVRALISASGAVSYNNTTGVISLTSGNLTEATSSVLTITGGTGAVLGSGTSIQVKQASSTVSGFLSSTDWSTFNGKASALSGTTGYHAKFTSSTTIGNGIIYDDGNQIGINVTPPTWYSNFKGLNLPNGSFIGYSTNASIFLSQNLYFNASGSWAYINTGTGGQYSIDGTGNHSFSTVVSGSANANATLVERFRIASTGASTFTSSVTAGGTITVPSDTSGTSGFIINYASNASSRSWKIANDFAAFGDFAIAQSTTQTGGTRDAKLYISPTGNVGISTSSPGARLEVAGADTTIRLRDSNGGVTDFGNDSVGTYWRDFSNNTFRWISSAGTERMKIFSGGNIAINTGTDNGYRLYVSGTIYATGNITANSDLTLKKNLQIITNPIDKLMQLNGYAYQWKSDDSHQYGVVAQEVEKILPYAVSTGNDGIKGVSYNQIIPVLIEAVKEQKKELEELRDILASK